MAKCSRHTYDEHGLCFECNKPRPSKADLMREMRSRRADEGLVEFRAWVTPEQRDQLQKHLDKL